MNFIPYVYYIIETHWGIGGPHRNIEKRNQFKLCIFKIHTDRRWQTCAYFVVICSNYKGILLLVNVKQQNSKVAQWHAITLCTKWRQIKNHAVKQSLATYTCIHLFHGKRREISGMLMPLAREPVLALKWMLPVSFFIIRIVFRYTSYVWYFGETWLCNVFYQKRMGNFTQNVCWCNSHNLTEGLFVNQLLKYVSCT